MPTKKKPKLSNVIRIFVRGQLRAVPDRAHVHRNRGVQWQCRKSFAVCFDPGSPFTDYHFFKGHSRSGKAKRNATSGKRYKYTVQVGSRSIDPGVIIWP